MYRFGMAIMKATTLTLLVATTMSYYYEGSSLRTCLLALSAGLSAVITLLMVGDHHGKMKNMPNSSLSVFDDVALRLVRQLPERPVMFYKDDVYDFVHNDPIAPDPRPNNA